MQAQPIIVAIFSLCGVLLGGGLQYVFGRALESRKQLALQKSQAYVDYFRAVAVIAQSGRSRENLSMAADAKVNLHLWLSWRHQPSARVRGRWRQYCGVPRANHHGRIA